MLVWWTSPPTPLHTVTCCLFSQLHCGTPLPSGPCSQLSNKIIGVALFSPLGWILLKAYSFVRNAEKYKDREFTQRHSFAPQQIIRPEAKTKGLLFWVQTYTRKTVSFLQWPKQRLFKKCVFMVLSCTEKLDWSSKWAHWRSSQYNKNLDA